MKASNTENRFETGFQQTKTGLPKKLVLTPDWVVAVNIFRVLLKHLVTPFSIIIAVILIILLLLLVQVAYCELPVSVLDCQSIPARQKFGSRFLRFLLHLANSADEYNERTLMKR